jgi:DNA-directed RNA polymerase subunit RPC12/RpoP
MRLLVEPALAGRCDECGGELRFKLTMLDDPAFDTEAEIFVCVTCGRERSHRVMHDRYAARTTSKKTSANLA